MIDETFRTASVRLAKRLPRRGALDMLGKALVAAGVALVAAPRIKQAGAIHGGCAGVGNCSGCPGTDCNCYFCAACGVCPGCNSIDSRDPPMNCRPVGWCWICCVAGGVYEACDYACTHSSCCGPTQEGCCDGAGHCAACFCFCKAPHGPVPGQPFPCNVPTDCANCAQTR